MSKYILFVFTKLQLLQSLKKKKDHCALNESSVFYGRKYWSIVLFLSFYFCLSGSSIYSQHSQCDKIRI